MARLAFMTYGKLKGSLNDPVVSEFVQHAGIIFRDLPTINGFIDHADSMPPKNNITDVRQLDYGAWGMFDVPSFYTGSTAPQEFNAALTLTLWTDIQSVYEFSYSGNHANALKHRQRWGLENNHPAYVMWWVEDDEMPTWQTGCRKIEILDSDGSSPQAFDFKHAYDQHGKRFKVNPSRLKTLK